MPRIEYEIPRNATVVFVSDFFVEDLVGGAELTSEALIQSCSKRCYKLHSASLTEGLVEASPGKYWIFGNFLGAPKPGIQAVVESGAHYSVIEFDWKYCRFRSPQRCGMTKSGKVCTCISTPDGQFVRGFYQEADKLFWMSKTQRDECLQRMEMSLDDSKHLVQGSTWSQEDLLFLKSLREDKETQREETWIVQDSPNEIKNTQGTIEYCKTNKIPYRLLGGLKPRDFLVEMRKNTGLVFHPLDYDTCPRVVVEAKLLGLRLDLNSNVMHQHDPWFQETSNIIHDWLWNSPSQFWKNLF